MSRFEQFERVDLASGPQRFAVRGGLFAKDAGGNRLGLIVQKNSIPVTVTGTIQGIAKLPPHTGNSVEKYEFNGVIDSNNPSCVYVDVPAEALYYPGQLTVAIRNNDGDTRTVLATFTGWVDSTTDGTAGVPPSTLPDDIEDFIAELSVVRQEIDGALDEIEAKGEEVLASIPQDYTELSTDVGDLKSAVPEITMVTSNVEPGGYATSGYITYAKTDNAYMARNVYDFFAPKGTTIAVSDTDYEFNMVTIDPSTGERTGTTGWVETYTLANPRICFVAYRHKSTNESSGLLVKNVASIFTTAAIKAMTTNVLVGEGENITSKMRYINADTYDNTLANALVQGMFVASTSDWNDLPSGAVTFCINAYQYDRLWWIQEATTVNAASGVKRFIRIVKTDNTIYRDWVDVGMDSILPVKDKYIATNGTSIGTTEQALDGWDYAKVHCFPGEEFTITGQGGGSARAYAFAESDGTIIERSNSGETLVNRIITAPTNAEWLVVCAKRFNGYSWVRGNAKILLDDFMTNAIANADIADVPSAIVKPTIAYIKNLQSNNVCQAKGAVFNNGDAFCVTYNENLDGTIDDYPRVSETGCLALKYRAFTLSGSTEQNATTGTVAQKGSSYTAWDGTTKAFTGGCGLASGNNGYLFFTSAYTGSHRYNGINNYGMTPCCVTVSVSSSGVPTFGTIKELSLTIDSTKGAFDVTRLSADNVDYQLYYTTNPPCYDTSANQWYWLIPVKKGFMVCWSSNAVDWTYVSTVYTTYQPYAEIACAVLDSSNVLFASRNVELGMTVGIIPRGGYGITQQYLIPAESARVFLAKAGSEYLMLYNGTVKSECQCVRIIRSGSRLFFRKWYTMHNECTWYASVNQDSIASGSFSNLYVVGGNGSLETNNGVSFAVLSIDGGYKTIGSLTTMIT